MYRPFTLALICILTALPAFAQVQNPRRIPFSWKTDTSQHIVDLSEFIVAVPRETFPKIDYPLFIRKSQGQKIYHPNEPVIALEINGIAKAYPLSILTVHEVSNDTLGGIPILVTYCPLCNSGVVYDRRLNIETNVQVLEFEVSGMLRYSDMIMFDKKTESWWQQLMGNALVGELSGRSLKFIPSLMISVQSFFLQYPNGSILSKENGDLRAQRQYGKNYYIHYDAPGAQPYQSFFDEAKLDHRLPAMERVVLLRGTSGNKIYPFSILAKKEVVNDHHEGKELVIFYQKGALSVLDEEVIAQSRDVGMASAFEARLEGRVFNFTVKERHFEDIQTASIWNISGKCIAGPLKGKQLKLIPHQIQFAFASLAFYPNAAIYSE